MWLLLLFIICCRESQRKKVKAKFIKNENERKLKEIYSSLSGTINLLLNFHSGAISFHSGAINESLVIKSFLNSAPYYNFI